MIKIELLMLFTFKIIDCVLCTFKTLFMIKGKQFLSSVCASVSQFFYLFLLIQVSKNSSKLGVFVICLATFIGTYTPKYIVDKLSRDKIWMYDVIPNSKNQSQRLADKLRNNNLAVCTYKGYNFDTDKILGIKVFSNNKEESNIIQDLIPKNVTYHVMEVKHYSCL